jgi:hypothetical protein
VGVSLLLLLPLSEFAFLPFSDDDCILRAGPQQEGDDDADDDGNVREAQSGGLLSQGVKIRAARPDARREDRAVRTGLEHGQQYRRRWKTSGSILS